MVAAKATYYETHDANMMQIKEGILYDFEWLNSIPKHKWCKHVFPFYFKCDVLMNNLSESFNATIFMHGDKPIITMFDWIRNYLMDRLATLREKQKKVVHVTFGDLVGIPCRRGVSAIHKKIDDSIKYLDALVALLNDVYILDVKPLSIDTSPVKPHVPAMNYASVNPMPDALNPILDVVNPMPTDMPTLTIITFIGKQPNVNKSTVRIFFGPKLKVPKSVLSAIPIDTKRENTKHPLTTNFE
ncbi:unnamed protein product [Vicia faba]|uniref:Uncharacterized protein n=1 Tax=Vicia faba TaxID=3906 RepID=A0AAV1AHX9_VICFA|nr:unnamed protein product [Vicia faba]